MGEAGKIPEIASKTTPMISQYLAIKEGYADYILFYRMGDFYEMFFSDAETASRELEITLTSRNKNEPAPVPMCGVPAKAAETYIGRLIEKGYKVAVCDQTEDPASAKGLVRREVVRVVTPGMVVNNELLDARSNNYILCIFKNGTNCGLSCLDLSTGVFRVAETSDPGLIIDESRRIGPSEILLPESGRSDAQYESFRDIFPTISWSFIADDLFDYPAARQRLLDHFRTRSLDGFGCENLKNAIGAAGALLWYVHDTQKRDLVHLSQLETYSLENFLLIDEISCRNLELLSNIQTGTRQGTLLGIMDITMTAMGGRVMKHWIRYPLLDAVEIKARQDAVAAASEHPAERKAIREILKPVCDLERLGGKLAMGQANARDLLALKRSIKSIPLILAELEAFADGLLKTDISVFGPLHALADEIEEAIVDDPPPTILEGGMIRRGYDADLDELIRISRDGKGYLAELEAAERVSTGINTLKVRYNKVFGYYIEVTKTQSAAVPGHYIRKQTLVNAERYITDELKTFEIKVLGAQEQQAILEYEIFSRLRTAIISENNSIQAASRFIALIDVLTALAELAERNGYCRPSINNDGVIHIEDGRHPVVEKLIAGERFVPNTVHLDNTENQILIVTGPNMAGKSTVLRQVALIVLMAQMGGFVPAKHADIGIVDRIFTRVGALDNLSQGQSTFMVEMEETANIMNNAGPESLVIMDEIGRGTSTFDGLSIAWAVVEYLHDLRGKGVKSLFATHYHEMTELPAIKTRVRNFNIAAREWNDEIIFLHQLVEGGANRSYGIQVARLAGMPDSIVKRAKKVLSNIEINGHVLESRKTARPRSKGEYEQLTLFRKPEALIMESLMKIDPLNTTPLEAINHLSRLKAIAMNGISDPE